MYLRFRFTVSVAGDLDIYPAHTDAQSFIAASVTIIVGNLVLHVIHFIIKTSEAVAYTLILRFTLFYGLYFTFLCSFHKCTDTYLNRRASHSTRLKVLMPSLSSLTGISPVNLKQPTHFDDVS